MEWVFSFILVDDPHIKLKGSHPVVDDVVVEKRLLIAIKDKKELK